MKPVHTLDLSTLSKPLVGWTIRENRHVDSWPIEPWEIVKLAVAVWLWGCVAWLVMV